jgi:hypothetical protein
MITVEQIQETETYKNANEIQKQFLLKRANRNIVQNAISVFNATKCITLGIGTTNIKLVKEILKIE